MDELADSGTLIDDPDGLCRRLATDGYVFFRGLLSASQVRAAGQAVLARLHSGVPRRHAQPGRPLATSRVT